MYFLSCVEIKTIIIIITYTSRVYVKQTVQTVLGPTTPRIIKQVETLSEFKIKLKRLFKQ